MSFILAQICGAIALVLVVINVQLKNKDSILKCQIIANIIVTIQYFLLNAITGAVIMIINTIRCIIFYYYNKKNKKTPILFFIVFIIIAIISGILTWENMFSIIPIIATIIFTYGLWQENVRITKICIMFASGTWIIYKVVVKAYVGAVQSLAECISAIIATISYKNKEEISNEKNNYHGCK